MSKDPKINLLNHLQAQNENDLREFSEIALKAGNKLLFETISKANSQINQKTSSLFQNNSLFFDICKSGTPFSYENFIKNRSDNKIYDENNNSCLHFAAKYGNFQVIFGSLVINLIKKIYSFSITFF